MTRRLIGLWIALFALPATAAPKTNVLFLAVDDLRPALGCYGDPAARTPNIDRLAAGGTVFLHAYVQQAVCSPSRSSVLTGRRPDTTKVYDLVTHFRDHIPDVITLPQHFKANGYTARSVGKIYHGGYDDPKSWSAAHEAMKGKVFGPDGQALLEKLRGEAKKNQADTSRIRGLPTEAPDVADDYLTDGANATRGCELLRELAAKPEPFFLAVGFARPHLPFVAPKKYWDAIDTTQLPTPTTTVPPQGAPAFASTIWGELRAYHGIPQVGPVPVAEARKLVHGYYAATSYMDAQVGRLLDELDRLKLAHNTVVVLWGDHGWHLGDHGQWCKHTNYEFATRSTLVMRSPSQKAPGKRTEALVEFVDIYPTLVESCGLALPAGLEGYSFAPLLDDAAKPWKSAAISQYPRGSRQTGPLMGYALRTNRYRLVEWRERKSGKPIAHELYDYQTDPHETKNLADDPASQPIVEALAKTLASGWKGLAPPR